MTQYRVLVRSVHSKEYLVEAEDREAAVDAALNDARMDMDLCVPEYEDKMEAVRCRKD